MNESLGQRIKRLRKAAKMSQAQLAEACGWKSQSRVGNYEAGTREPMLADIAEIAKALGVDESEILLDLSKVITNTDLGGLTYEPPNRDAAPTRSEDLVRDMLAKYGRGLPQEIRDKIAAVATSSVSNVVAVDFSRPGQVGDEVWIAHYDVRAAMGGGQVPHDYPEMLQDIRVSPKHLREMGVEFKEHFHLKMVTGWGQSMAPTIKHRDPLLVDVSIREFVGDGIYLFSHEDLLYIKRLQKKGKDHFKMISDNTNHPPEDIRVDDTFIQARVLLVWNAHLV
ncbi:helix-turn-helix domain-containing protein [Pseudomonas silvicola]|nr:helix-turn-helix domain-containing protein [Pseudomonas silvicola]